MQIFTKRGSTSRPQLTMELMTGTIENNFRPSLAPNHTIDGQLSGVEGRWAYQAGGSWDYTGQWTPGKQTTRASGSGGSRFTMGAITVDASVRIARTQTQQRGSWFQGQEDRRERGEWMLEGSSRVTDQRYLLHGQTLGITVGYAPTTWWSQEVAIGYDLADVETFYREPRRNNVSDSLMYLSTSTNHRMSQRYHSTLQVPVTLQATMLLTVGIDHWDNSQLTMTTSSASLTGTLTTPTVTRPKPGRNTGGFFQGQVAIHDALFLTYGLRAEWNPNYGNEAQPNLAPRYGLAYTTDLGPVTTKVRASYGRSTRPPEETRKLAEQITNTSWIADYGRYDSRLANPELGPEFQQGGEGGVELYFGNRASLIITRYNQTVDRLISSVSGVDSVRSLAPNPRSAASTFRDPDGYGYRYQSQYLNLGSIRNQGWELQGSVNTGPFVTRGTYSWTKSRVIGITPRYRTLVTSSNLEVGRSFNFLPEHTWMLSTTYARAGTTISVNVNGAGQRYLIEDEFHRLVGGYNFVRYFTYFPRVGLPSNYRVQGPGYVMADLNASHRFSSHLDGVLQVRNLSNYYPNDVNIDFATMGRQTKMGLRMRL
jgi:outer membrane receptor for ferrienterochelin and colicin